MPEVSHETHASCWEVLRGNGVGGGGRVLRDTFNRMMIAVKVIVLVEQGKERGES